MKKLLIAGVAGLALAGCANANRTVPVIVVEETTIPSFDVYPPPIPKDETIIVEDLSPRSKLVVPKNHSKIPLPPSRPYRDSIVEDYKKNNYNK